MRNFKTFAFFLFGILFTTLNVFSKNNPVPEILILAEELALNYTGPSIDNNTITTFFKKYPDLKPYENEVLNLYKTRAYKAIWYQGEDISEFGHLLYHQLNSSYQEGIKLQIPYKKQMDQIFNENSSQKSSNTDTELLLSSMYILYAKHVFFGMDASSQEKIKWFLPKKKLSYATVLDSILNNPDLLKKDEQVLFSQYYKLHEVLKKYRTIERNGSWNKISISSPFQDLRPEATSQTIADIRQRLAVVGDLATDSKSNFYDQELMDGIMKYKLRYALKPNYIITKDFIDQMNEPVSDRIKTIMLNMERCRWIPPSLEKQDEFVMVNIPSFKLYYIKNGNFDLVSNVFIGTPLTKTVIFSGQIDRIVFSPYWYMPANIIQNELKLKMAEDKNYLAEHNMEWNGGRVRQKPGPDNALGLVKFIFPNPNDIYMHDTPSKSLFGFEKRIFSHGCINVEKAKELAVSMLKDYPEWTTDKINQAMSGKTETPFILKKKVPIYIGYFTAWVNKDGDIGFFPDVYERDPQLNSILFPEDVNYKTEN